MSNEYEELQTDFGVRDPVRYPWMNQIGENFANHEERIGDAETAVADHEDRLTVLDGGTLGTQPPVTVTLSDQQIKALPTTPITLVAAPGAGYRWRVTSASLCANTSGGAYTNIDATYAALAIYWLGDFTQWATVGIVDDSGASLARLSSLLGTQAVFTANLTSYLDVFSSGWAVPNVVASSISENKALAIAIDNNGSSNLGGGHSFANALQVTVHYVREAIEAGMPFSAMPVGGRPIRRRPTPRRRTVIVTGSTS